MVFVSGSLFPVFLETGRSFFLVFSHLGLNDVISLTACVRRRESSSRRAGERGRRVGGSKGWTLRRGGSQEFRVFLFRLLPQNYFLSGGLLVDLWSRFKAVDHTQFAFGLLGVIVCEPR